MGEKDTCEICFEKFNRTRRIRVQCPGCDFPVCRLCTKTYLVQTNSLPHCLNCKNRWELNTLINATSKNFVEGEYKLHRSEMLFQQEQSRFPETMPFVENFREIERLKSKKAEIKIYLEEAKQRYDNIHCVYLEIESKIRKKSRGGELGRKEEFKRGCPKEDCRGFLSSEWKCCLCETKVCPKCLLIKKDAEKHICERENIETAKVIKKETKSCPSCGINIFKIAGCDQMWCTQCRVGFSWKTGKIVTGVIHNPHFYQWERTRRTNGEATVNPPNAVMCGGIPYFQSWRKSLQDFIPLSLEPACIEKHKVRNFLYNMHMYANHFFEDVLNTQRVICANVSDNRDLRIQYILGNLSKEDFKTAIVRGDKKYMKSRAVLEIYELINIIVTETMRDIHETMIESDSSEEAFLSVVEKIKRFEEIRRYGNVELGKISLIYSQTVGFVNHKFAIVNKKLKKKDLRIFENGTKEEERDFLRPSEENV